MNMTERNYLHSRPLDVHRWSEHPESNIFVDTTYNDEFKNGKRKRILPIVDSFNQYLIYK